MKLAAKAVEPFIARPDPAASLLLVYGPDAGLVAERARRLALTVLDDLGDPFRVSELGADRLRQEPRLLAEEAQALCLMGGRRVVRVRQVGDADAAAAVRLLLESGAPEALVVIEGGDLGGSSALRRLVEGAAFGMALPCYRDEDRDIESLVRSALGAAGLKAEPDALGYLVAHLGSDRAVTRQELDKLALYIGEREDRTVRLADVAAVVDDNAALAIDDAIRAAVLGEAELDARLQRLFAEGQRPEGVLRQTARFLLMLLRLAQQVEGGTAASTAIAAIRPPLFFRTKFTVERALPRWRAHDLVRALAALQLAEARSRQRGIPSETVCRQAMSAIAAIRDAGGAGQPAGLR